MENNNKQPKQRSNRGRGGQGGRGQNGNNAGPRRAGQNQSGLSVPGANVSRGAAVRAQRRIQADAQKIANQYAPAAATPAEGQQRRAKVITDDFDKLKITFLGGQGGIG